MADDKDLYTSLGVSRKASADEIRSAYRKLARKCHPDVNPGDKSAEDRFKEISVAYEVLSDAEKRKAYDEFGADSLRGSFDAEKAQAYRQWKQGRQASGHPFEHEVADFDLGDVFAGFGAVGRRGPTRGQDIMASVEVDLAQAIQGIEVSLDVPSAVSCPRCHGSGKLPGSGSGTCAQCGGSGTREVSRGPMRMATTCSACSGSGETGKACPACGGQGHRVAQKKTRVRIPPGADTGSTVRVSGRGTPGRQGGLPGDLVIETRVRPHPLLRRDGLDLSLKLPVTLTEAYSGATVDVPTFDGPVKLRIPARTQSGSRLRLRGKGVARAGRKGDLYVEVEVRLPEVDDAKLAQALKSAQDKYTRPVREGVRL
jgi:molecular chaperone DnaJ